MNKKKIVELTYLAFNDAIKTKANATKIVDFVFEEIRQAIVREEEVAISGFGKFVVVERKARRGVNPQTGDPIQIPASKTVKFKVTKSLKEDIN